MSEQEPQAQAEITPSRRLSVVWIVPIVALGLGIWMAFYTFSTRGPLITIRFATAEGIEAGKTKIKALSVDVGQVESVHLHTDMSGIEVSARLDKEVTDLLRDDTQFWVVRPRIGSAGISGLGTLLSGAYIELSPGRGETGQDTFVGLEQVPVTPSGTPGLHVTLFGRGTKSLSSGDPVLYQGFIVGRVESAEFNPTERQAYYQLFIRAPYNDLVTINTRFWNVSGLNVRTSANGIQIDTGSLESMLVGGVAFAVPQGMTLGEGINGRAEFRLYPDQQQINERAFEYYLEYVLLSDTSVRGLEAGAPVEYRGLRVGTVISPNLPYADNTSALDEARIPVLIRVEPSRMGLSDNPQAVETVRARIPELVQKQGLRATLKSGNLFTGSLYVDLDFYPDAQPVSLKTFRQHPVLPTVSSGFAQLEARLDAVLQKLQKLPIEPILQDASGVLTETQKTLQGVQSTLDGLEKLLAQESLKTIPDSLNASLVELTEALRSFSSDSPLYQEVDRSLEKFQDFIWDLQPLVKALSNKPNSLLFGGPQAADPEPQGRKR